MYKLGIIGFGVVGKSVLSFLKKYHVDGAPPSDQELFDDEFINRSIEVSVWDARSFTQEELDLLSIYGAKGYSQAYMSLDEFMSQNNFVIPSPGVSLEKLLQKYYEKLLGELDFFAVFFRKPTVAVTGSLGKTTVTRLQHKTLGCMRMLDYDDRPKELTTSYLTKQLPSTETIKPFVAGNIGVGMLDLVSAADDIDCAVLELSSFQLELNNKYAPDIAIWTNFYPNHLDRHGTLDAYFNCKWNLFVHQKEYQTSIMTRGLFEGAAKSFIYGKIQTLKSVVVIVDSQDLSLDFIKTVPLSRFKYMYIHESMLFMVDVVDGTIKGARGICRIDRLPETTFLENWQLVLAATYFAGGDMHDLEAKIADGKVLLDDNFYRLNKFATIKGVDFYDDSKSTIAQATLAAVNKLTAQSRPLVLILGGIGKGVDRSFIMQEITKNTLIKKVYCFGPECWVFQGADVKQSLEDVVKDLDKHITSGDQVLFSPSGASFDSFKNYEHRGQVFETLVKSLIADTTS